MYLFFNTEQHQTLSPTNIEVNLNGSDFLF